MTSHDLDLTCWYLEARPVEVYAREVRGTLAGRGIGAHDGVQAVVAFEGGATAAFQSSWIAPDTYPLVAGGSIEIVGTEGLISYAMNGRRAAIYTEDASQEIQFGGPHTADEKKGTLHGAFVRSVGAFLQAVVEGREADTSARNTLHVTQAQCAMMRSIAQGRAIAV